MSVVTSSTKPRVCSFESRRASEMESLLQRNDAIATVAPSMRECPLNEHTEAFAYAEKLLSGEIDITVFMTGVGASTLLSAVETKFDRDEFLAALRNQAVIVRGPKPQIVMREWHVDVTARAPEPNTWRELLDVMDELDLTGKTIAVQEYGQPNEQFAQALRERGGNVMSVTVYAWTLPEDLAPLQSAIRSGAEHNFDVTLFTSAQQIRHVVQIAESLGVRETWTAAANSSVIGSIGPTCSEALVEAGLTVSMEPSHPTMGHLVKEAVACWRHIRKETAS